MILVKPLQIIPTLHANCQFLDIRQNLLKRPAIHYLWPPSTLNRVNLILPRVQVATRRIVEGLYKLHIISALAGHRELRDDDIHVTSLQSLLPFRQARVRNGLEVGVDIQVLYDLLRQLDFEHVGVVVCIVTTQGLNERW